MRQGRDLLRDIIDADRGGADEEAQYRQIQSARSPFNPVRRRQRQVAPGKPPKTAKVGTPAIGDAIMAGHGNDGCDKRGEHRQHVGENEAVAGRIKGEGEGADADRPGFYDRPRAHRRADVKTIGAGRQGHIRTGHRDHDQRQQPVQPVDRTVGEHGGGKGDQQASGDQRGAQCHDHGVGHDMAVRSFRLRQCARQPTFQPQRRKLCRKFDDQHRIGEPAQRFSAIPASGDEQERQPRRQTQQEPE